MRRLQPILLGCMMLACTVVTGCRQGATGVREEYVAVRSLADGDTIVLSTGERVRLIGIDTPEVYESEKLHRDARRTGKNPRDIREMGRRASAYARSLLEGRRVRLEFDEVRRDRYNRLLAYVYLEDGTFVNAALVEAGYASLMKIPPNVKHAARFEELYRQARELKRGLWSE